MDGTWEEGEILAFTVDLGIAYFMLLPLEALVRIRNGVTGMETSWCFTLYIITVLLCILRCWRVFHWRSASIAVTLLVLLYSPFTNRATLRWTISSLFMLRWVCEFVTFPLVSWVRCGTWLYRFLVFSPLLTFHTQESYSTTGHTSDFGTFPSL